MFSTVLPPSVDKCLFLSIIYIAKPCCHSGIRLLSRKSLFMYTFI